MCTVVGLIGLNADEMDRFHRLLCPRLLLSTLDFNTGTTSWWWSGLDSIGLDWIGLDWIGLDWIGLDGMVRWVVELFLRLFMLCVGFVCLSVCIDDQAKVNATCKSIDGNREINWRICTHTVGFDGHRYRDS